MRKEIIKGKLGFYDDEPEYTTIEIDGEESVLIEVIKSKLDKTYKVSKCFEWYDEDESWDFEKLVTVRYGISDKPIKDLDVLMADYVMQLYGDSELKSTIFATDVTGYIWTNENFQVGGHDIIEEIDAEWTNNGKYLFLEITIHEEDDTNG